MSTQNTERRSSRRSDELLVTAPILRIHEEEIDPVYLSLFALERVITREIDISGKLPTSEADLIREMEIQAAKMGAADPQGVSQRVLDRLLNRQGSRTRLMPFEYKWYDSIDGLQVKKFNLLKMTHEGWHTSIRATDETRQLILRMLMLHDDMAAIDLELEALRLSLNSDRVDDATLGAVNLRFKTDERVRVMQEKAMLCRIEPDPDWDGLIDESSQSIEHVTKTRQKAELLLESEKTKRESQGYAEFRIALAGAINSLSRLRRILWAIHNETQQMMMARFELEPDPMMAPDEILRRLLNAISPEHEEAMAEATHRVFTGITVPRMVNLEHFINFSLADVPDDFEDITAGDVSIPDGADIQEATDLSQVLVDGLLQDNRLNLTELGTMTDDGLNKRLEVDLDRFQCSRVLHQAIARVYSMYTANIATLDPVRGSEINTNRYAGNDIHIKEVADHAARRRQTG